MGNDLYMRVSISAPTFPPSLAAGILGLTVAAMRGAIPDRYIAAALAGARLAVPLYPMEFVYLADVYYDAFEVRSGVQLRPRQQMHGQTAYARGVGGRERIAMEDFTSRCVHAALAARRMVVQDWVEGLERGAPVWTAVLDREAMVPSGLEPRAGPGPPKVSVLEPGCVVVRKALDEATQIWLATLAMQVIACLCPMLWSGRPLKGGMQPPEALEANKQCAIII